MVITPITETTGVAMTLTLAEARELQAELAFLVNDHKHHSIRRTSAISDQLDVLLGEQEPPF